VILKLEENDKEIGYKKWNKEIKRIIKGKIKREDEYFKEPAKEIMRDIRMIIKRMRYKKGEIKMEIEKGNGKEISKKNVEKMIEWWEQILEQVTKKKGNIIDEDDNEMYKSAYLGVNVKWVKTREGEKINKF